MADATDQDALFQIEGPDEDGSVWACSPDGRDVWCNHLGSADAASEVMSQWLAAVDPAQVAVRLTPEQLARLDGWMTEQGGEVLTRPRAISRLIDLLLA
jgi:hypothetical protein